ncbi:MAG: right-handed parallel beta-helix repeat-containing protein [Flavobacteriales bacterium]|nr:right-handed parallel beta-helix repeat-containing protein [Flavobacteriales bacterium]
MNPLIRLSRLPLFAVLLSFEAQAQYTTPNTGQSYGLAELVDISGGVFTVTSDTSYLQNADFTLAATDTLLITEDVIWAVAATASIDIAGSFITAPPEQLYITSATADQPHQGMRFEDSSSVYMQRTSILEGGSIKCLTGDLTLSYCTVSAQVANATTGAALELSRGKAIIDHVDFLNNEMAAISSSANIAAAPQISYCNFQYNGYANQNRPQINLGPSGTDTTRILNNVVTGDPTNTMAGGIAFSSLLGVEGHVVIDSNTVTDNRYGITVTGNTITAPITNNIITDNNTQGDPNLGGSGINLYGGGHQRVHGFRQPDHGEPVGSDLAGCRHHQLRRHGSGNLQSGWQFLLSQRQWRRDLRPVQQHAQRRAGHEQLLGLRKPDDRLHFRSRRDLRCGR